MGEDVPLSVLRYASPPSIPVTSRLRLVFPLACCLLNRCPLSPVLLLMLAFRLPCVLASMSPLGPFVCSQQSPLSFGGLLVSPSTLPCVPIVTRCIHHLTCLYLFTFEPVSLLPKVSFPSGSTVPCAGLSCRYLVLNPLCYTKASNPCLLPGWESVRCMHLAFHR